MIHYEPFYIVHSCCTHHAPRYHLFLSTLQKQSSIHTSLNYNSHCNHIMQYAGINAIPRTPLWYMTTISRFYYRLYHPNIFTIFAVYTTYTRTPCQCNKPLTMLHSTQHICYIHFPRIDWRLHTTHHSSSSCIIPPIIDTSFIVNQLQTHSYLPWLKIQLHPSRRRKKHRNSLRRSKRKDTSN